ncbi:MAG: helix-turn-helix domain-containing protein [Candidatus Pacearchaeota archaeon]|jgi:sugar-specific transcriptional regulator TrmB
MDNLIVKQLMAGGLTQNEARVYIGLLELKQSKTGKLSEHVGIPSSHLYPLLQDLIKLGLVSYKFVNKRKVFMPSSPNVLNEIYLRKKQELENQRIVIQSSIQNLKQFSPKEEKDSDYQYFEGLLGIKGMWSEINELMIPNTQARCFASIIEGFEMLNQFYLEHHKLRVSKNIFEKMILPVGAERFANQRKKLGKFDVRFLDLKNLAEFIVFDDFMCIQYIVKDKPRGFLIKDSVFAQSFANIFDNLWKSAKK